MKNLVTLAAAAVMAGAWLGGASAATVDVDTEIEGKIVSAHVWRGRVIHDEPSFQPSLTLTANNILFNVWGTWDVIERDDTWERTRMDGTLAYSWISGKQIITSGIVAYVYNDGTRRSTRDTFELFVEASADVFLLPSVTVYYDFESIEGIYGSVAVAHSFEFFENRAGLDLGMFLGGADADYSRATFELEQEENTELPAASLVDFTATVSLPVYLRDNLAVMPGIKLMSLIDPTLRRAVRAAGHEERKLVGSLSLVGTF